MKPLIFVRHCETDLAGRFCGHLDPMLNAAGCRQVDRVLSDLSSLPVEIVYTSDLQRARQTAERIARHYDARLEVRPGLREISFGDWEGLSWDEVQLQYPDDAKRWATEFPRSSATGGERFFDFEARVFREVDLLLDRIVSRQVVVVSHAGFISVALTQIFGFSVREAWEQTRSYGAVIQVDPCNCKTILKGANL